MNKTFKITFQSRSTTHKCIACQMLASCPPGEHVVWFASWKVQSFENVQRFSSWWCCVLTDSLSLNVQELNLYDFSVFTLITENVKIAWKIK